MDTLEPRTPEQMRRLHTFDDGALVAHFDPSRPDEIGGDGRHRLLPLMHEAGFDTGPVDDAGWDTRYDEPIARSLRPAGLITGVLPALEHTPGLAAAPAAARRGEPVALTPDSDLGRHVRAWSGPARRASWSLNFARDRTTDEERATGHRYGHLVQALSAAVRADRA
ncbi:DUF6461 domain-containing protein [Lentzea sp. NPDC060358]|uniref:DUF6461 domain-containing protein n=1 Tax=Lentzea sp. NPDC060358 TaxID=3347103 RepID=UPI003662BBA7